MRKRKKKKLPRGSSCSRSSRVRLGRALVLRGFLMCSLPNCCCGRALRRSRQWHMLEWFGWLLLALCSFLLSYTGPRCSASWPIWTRRTVLRYLPAVACAKVVLLVILHLTLFFPSCRQAQMLGIMAGLDQMDSYAVACARLGLLVFSLRDVFLVWFRP